MQSKSFHWMLREAKILTTLGLPPAIICLTEGMQAKLSNVFIGRSSGNNISMMWTALYIAQIVTNLSSYPFSLGIAAYVNILCSQAYGAKQHRLVGLYFYRALSLTALTLFPICTLFMCVRPFIYSVTHDEELAYQAGTFMSIFCFGYLPYVYHKVAIAFLQSQNIVWPSLFYLVIGNICNGLLQYFLIMQYGTGIAGAATGYVISMYLLSLLLYAHIRFTSVHTLTHVDWTVEMIGEWYHTFQYAISTTIQMFASVYTSGLLPLIVLGAIAHDETQVGIYSILYSLWFVFYLFAIGYGSAITVRIGNLLGANDPILARKAAIFGFIFGVVVLILNSSVLFMLSEPLGYLFTTVSTLAIELSFSTKILAIALLADIVILEQAILNACCLQQVDAILKLVFRIVLNTVIGCVWAQYVEWKALSLLATLAIMCLISTIIGLIVVSCHNWETFARKVRKNTGIDFEHNDDEIAQAAKSSIFIRAFCDHKIYDSKKFIIFRYSLCMLISFIIFAFVLGFSV